MPRRSSKRSKPDSVYDKALQLLVRREHSARELSSKLRQRGFASDEIAEALVRLQASDFQSDTRFGEMLVRSRIQSGYGPRWIVAELNTHGIDDAAAASFLDAADPDWLVVGLNLLRRRYASACSPGVEQQRKHAGFLLRRGFDAPTVQSIIRAYGTGASADELD